MFTYVSVSIVVSVHVEYWKNDPFVVIKHELNIWVGFTSGQHLTKKKQILLKPTLCNPQRGNLAFNQVTCIDTVQRTKTTSSPSFAYSERDR